MSRNPSIFLKDSAFALKGFKILKKDIKNAGKKGVCILIRDGISDVGFLIDVSKIDDFGRK